MPDGEKELSVITKAKDLCSYVMTITQRSPKQFCVSRPKRGAYINNITCIGIVAF